MRKQRTWSRSITWILLFAVLGIMWPRQGRANDEEIVAALVELLHQADQGLANREDYEQLLNRLKGQSLFKYHLDQNILSRAQSAVQKLPSNPRTSTPGVSKYVLNRLPAAPPCFAQPKKLRLFPILYRPVMRGGVSAEVSSGLVLIDFGEGTRRIFPEQVLRACARTRGGGAEPGEDSAEE